MKKIFNIILICLIFQGFVSVNAFSFPEKDQPVKVIVVKGPIFTSTARYIERGIKLAEETSSICIIQLDTPGGLITSMRDIIQAILASDVPVVVYVGPHGAMATSAGTYITYSSHLAAMAPGTHIGSAHPVSIGMDNKREKKKDKKDKDPFDFNLPGISEKSDDNEETEKDKKEEKQSDTEEVDVNIEKATNAMVALIRSLAEKTGRNGEWGEESVRESASITAQKAIEMNVVEIYAEDIPDLLEKMRGRQVTLMGKKTVTLYPSQDNIEYVNMTGIETFLLTLNDPQIAVILMFLGTLGLYYELANPGATVPGIIGGICIILGLYTLGSLPINYTGLALIILSAILFIAEVFTPTFGALTMGGVISFVLGSIFLIPAGIPYLQISRGLIGGIAVAMTVISALLFHFVIKSMKSRPVVGNQSLIGLKAVVRKEISPTGMVMLKGEFWKARTLGDIIKEGSAVEVKKVEGLTLFVEPAEEESES